ncbi:MAG: hypothetical protein KIT09_16385 [Bryobacteraceae bacterium]|nr:hypothetical protein [Bryobacteraceae bacterium]
MKGKNMLNNTRFSRGCRANIAVAGILTAILLLAPVRLQAHCDGMDGPVVTAARDALETNNVDLVLIWVPAEDEAAVREAFAETQKVRELSPAAKDLSDRYFFETVVRIHRSAEGAPYTGLKPAGRDLGPAIPAADEAIEAGSLEDVIRLLTQAIEDGLQERFNEVQQRFSRVMSTKQYASTDIRSGREYVESYVEFLHYVEGLYLATQEHPAIHQ